MVLLAHARHAGLRRAEVRQAQNVRRKVTFVVLIPLIFYCLAIPLVWSTRGAPYAVARAELDNILRQRSEVDVTVSKHSAESADDDEELMVMTKQKVRVLDSEDLLVDDVKSSVVVTPEEVAAFEDFSDSASAAGKGALEALDVTAGLDDLLGESDGDGGLWDTLVGRVRTARQQRKQASSLTSEKKEGGSETQEEVDAEEERRRAEFDAKLDRLPSEYLPDAWASAFLLTVICAHALFHLMCRWFVWFRAAAFHPPASELADGCVVEVTPQPHRGRPALVPLKRNPRTNLFEFVFQRQKFEIVPETPTQTTDATAPAKPAAPEDDETEVVGDVRNGVARLVQCPVDLPLSHYTMHGGLSPSEIADRKERYGRNILSIPEPRFIDLWFEALLSPISIFQMFSAALWMLDAYWQYMAFTLVQIFVLESATVFQQIRSRKTLMGMCAQPFSVLVYRSQQWQWVITEELLPGDLMSLRSKTLQTEPNTADQTAAAGSAPTVSKTVGSDIIPCDCILIRGSAVTNEATLTGESVPQMKDSLPVGASRLLDLEGQDRVHTLFSGTALMSSVPDSDSLSAADIPTTPDGGCLCYVVRTGFSSSQGALVQMIEFSSQKVSSDSKETFMALSMMLCFALVAAGYVLKVGLEKGEKTTHELLVKCVLILTSVVPRQLPLQMALAVNQALMALTKRGLFCTEPFRVPFAGKITHCLFDKTGTLTTDQLIPVGLLSAVQGGHETANDLQDFADADTASSLVLAGCHSLIDVHGQGLVGDPIELAALRGVRWSYDAKKQVSTPGEWESAETAKTKLEEEVSRLPPGSDSTSLQARISKLEATASKGKSIAAQSPINSLHIIVRNHFSSKLQRMSVVCRVQSKKNSEFSAGFYCLVKGSPEAIADLLVGGSRPEWYDRAYRDLAERGMRVLALAYKRFDIDGDRVAKVSREDAECELIFAGFIAFECKVRADSPLVVKSLRASDHIPAMVTGDAALTAIHVAKQCQICDPDQVVLLLDVDQHENLTWAGAALRDSQISMAFEVAKMRELSETYALAVTETALKIAARQTGGTIWSEIDTVRIFARMSPRGKARVIRSMQERGLFVLMCGDGGNDVGALKQSDVGLALLSGYGNTNTAGSKAASTEGEAAQPVDAEEELNRQSSVLAVRSASASTKVAALLKAKQAELQRKMTQEWHPAEIRARQSRGESVGAMAQIQITISLGKRLRAELAAERNRLMRLHGNVFDDADSAASSLMEEASAGGAPVIRPGDASVAAPFTSRAPSIKGVVDLVRQGRCTLLNALQQQQIMMLESTVAAYTLAAISLEGSRSSERQMMLSSWFIMTASVAFSYAAPVEKMSPIRPLRSLFHPAILASTLGQAAIHIYCMARAVNLATTTMGPETLAEVKEFNRKVRLGEDVAAATGELDEMDSVEQMLSMWAAPFMPNLMNSVVFLVETAQIIGILFVNYKGRPWMKGTLENHPLILSILATIAGVVALAWELNPTVNGLMHLLQFPSDSFRYQVLTLVLLGLFGTFIWDRLCVWFFAPDIWKAMSDSAKETTFADILPAFKSLGKVLLVLAIFGTGNPIVWGVAFLGYRRWKAAKTARDQQAALAAERSAAGIAATTPAQQVAAAAISDASGARTTGDELRRRH